VARERGLGWNLGRSELTLRQAHGWQVRS